ncbi:MAG: hypothetical protein RAP41_06630 [Candidatus Orphnella occulta]|nr:hypothetical protein [Candidatus Orphnella occulta]
MKKNKIIGALLLILAVYTIAGMIVASDAFWLIYNFVVIISCVISGILLLREY